MDWDTGEETLEPEDSFEATLRAEVINGLPSGWVTHERLLYERAELPSRRNWYYLTLSCPRKPLGQLEHLGRHAAAAARRARVVVTYM